MNAVLFKKTKKSNPYQELLEKSQELLETMQRDPLQAQSLELSSAASPEARAVAHNLNLVLRKWKEAAENAEIRLDLVAKAVGMGTWEMNIVNGELQHPDNTVA